MAVYAVTRPQIHALIGQVFGPRARHIALCATALQASENGKLTPAQMALLAKPLPPVKGEVIMSRTPVKAAKATPVQATTRVAVSRSASVTLTLRKVTKNNALYGADDLERWQWHYFDKSMFPAEPPETVTVTVSW